MNVVIEASALNKALKQVAPAVSPNKIMSILEYVKCDVSKNEMQITATNLNLTAISKVACESNKEFTFLLPFAQASNIANVSTGIVTIESDKNVTIKKDKTIHQLGKSEDVINFPAIDNVDPHFEIDVDETFVYYLQNAANFTSNEPNQVVFQNVCIDFDGKNVNVVSTDAMSLFLFKDFAKNVKPVQYLINTSFCKAVKSFKQAKFSGNEKFITLADNNFKLICRIDENKFPNYKTFFPEYTHNCKVSKTAILDALSQLMVFESKLYICDIIFQKNSLKIVFNDTLVGHHFETEIPCDHSVEFEKISFNALHLKNIIMSLPQTEKVLMSFSSSSAVAHFDTEDSGLNLILIPIFNN